MRFITALAIFSLAAPALAMPRAQPLTPAPMSRRTNLWEKWTGDNACSDHDKVENCKLVGEDCNEHCECTPYEGCGCSATYWCSQKHGTLDEHCECIVPSGWTDPHDPHDPHVRRRATMACPMGQSACLIDPRASTIKTECLDLLTTLDSCGGCTTEGKGIDCTTLQGVEDVSCEYGACKIYSCERGFKLENGTACVADESGASSVKKLVIGGLAGAEKFWNH